MMVKKKKAAPKTATKKKLGRPKKKAYSINQLGTQGHPNAHGPWRQRAQKKYDTREVVLGNVNAIIKRRGLKKKQFGEIIGIHDPSVTTKLLKGERQISVQLLDDMAWALGVRPEELTAVPQEAVKEPTGDYSLVIPMGSGKSVKLTFSEELTSDEYDRLISMLEISKPGVVKEG